MITKKILPLYCIAVLALQGTAFSANFTGSPDGNATNSNTNTYAASGIIDAETNSMAATGPNGAGPDVRDPKYYEATDRVFLGTWECTNDMNSKLTIKEAHPQTGGYYADFFFYRIANADGYANISGDKLSINQGSVNDTHNFRGIFEKTQTGIRFTITESAFPYLKPGEKFEYKKMSGKPAVADTDILGKWTLRSWANAGIVCYEFTKNNFWTAYSPQWVGPDPKAKTDENGVLKTVASGHYKIQHEGNYNPVFKLYEANGKFYAYVSIDQDDRWKVLSINGKKSWFYKED